jgi:hypothetical protein
VLLDHPGGADQSLTVYDVSTRAPIVNEQVVADKSSRMDLDGFVTLSAFSCGEHSGQQASCSGGCPGPSAE